MKEGKCSVRGRVARVLLVVIRATFGENNLVRTYIRNHEKVWRCPEGYTFEKIQQEQYIIEYISHKRNKNGKVILQLHGGGYLFKLKNIYRNFAIYYARVSKGCDVCTVDYRVAPKYPYPTALIDAIDAYQWLRVHKGFGPEDIIVAGDSAGGGLTLSLCLYLKNNNQPLPKALICMSAWTDLTNSGESYVTNFKKDPIFGRTTNNMLYHSTYIGEENPCNPYISPLFGELFEFPPILLQVGTHEVLLSDTLDIAKKLKEKGSIVKVSIYEGMFHVFQMAGKLLPESRKAWREVGKFIKKQV